MERDSKREHHNALERNRRNHIKDNFERLKEALPMLAGEKASRSVVLNHATSFVEASNLEYDLMKTSIESLGPEVDFLNAQLEYINSCIKEGVTPIINPELIQLINTYTHAASTLTPHSISNSSQSLINGSNHPPNGVAKLPPLQTMALDRAPKEELTESVLQGQISSEEDSEDESC